MVAAIDAEDADVEFFEYPGDGHLPTDPSLADEYDPESRKLLWERVLAFCDADGRPHDDPDGGTP